MNAPFRPRDYSLGDPDQSFWDNPKPRITFVEDIEEELRGDRFGRWFALAAIALVAATILIPGFAWIARVIAQ